MSVNNGGSPFVSRELQQAIEDLRKFLIPSIPPMVQYDFPDLTEMMGLKGLRNSLWQATGIQEIVQEALRVPLNTNTDLLTSPAMTQTLAGIRAIYAEHADATSAIARQSTQRLSLIDELARATGSDTDPIESIYDEVEHAAEDDFASDEILAPARKNRVAQLTKTQHDALSRFLTRWGANFGVDYAVLSASLGDAYVVDVLHWAAALAVIQVIVYSLLPAPIDDDATK